MELTGVSQGKDFVMELNQSVIPIERSGKKINSEVNNAQKIGCGIPEKICRAAKRAYVMLVNLKGRACGPKGENIQVYPILIQTEAGRNKPRSEEQNNHKVTAPPSEQSTIEPDSPFQEPGEIGYGVVGAQSLGGIIPMEIVTKIINTKIDLDLADIVNSLNNIKVSQIGAVNIDDIKKIIHNYIEDKNDEKLISDLVKNYNYIMPKKKLNFYLNENKLDVVTLSYYYNLSNKLRNLISIINKDEEFDKQHEILIEKNLEIYNNNTFYYADLSDLSDLSGLSDSDE